jgi:hypothetical protein
MNGRSKPVNPAAFDDCPVSIPRTKCPQTRFDCVCPVTSRGELEEKSDQHRFFFFADVQFLQSIVQKTYTPSPDGLAARLRLVKKRRASRISGLLSGDAAV